MSRRSWRHRRSCGGRRRGGQGRLQRLATAEGLRVLAAQGAGTERHARAQLEGLAMRTGRSVAELSLLVLNHGLHLRHMDRTSGRG